MMNIDEAVKQVHAEYRETIVSQCLEALDDLTEGANDLNFSDMKPVAAMIDALSHAIEVVRVD